MNLRLIIAFFSTAFPWRRDVKQDSLLLDLHLCLISEIFDKLDWPDQVVFSKTCNYFEDPVILIMYSLFQQPSGIPYPGFHWRRFSCDNCPSDYEFIMKENYRLQSNQFLYEHGSIKTMFNSAGTP